MQVAGADGPDVSVEVLAETLLPGGQGEDAGQERGGGNGSAFEIGYLVPASGEVLGGHVVPGQPAHPAADEVRQGDPVPPSPQASGEPECLSAVIQ